MNASLVPALRRELLKQHHVAAHEEWIEDCVNTLASMPASKNVRNMPLSQALPMVYREFLNANLTETGEGKLPSNLDTWHSKVLSGTYVVQVNEIVNVADSIQNSGMEEEDNQGKSGQNQRGNSRNQNNNWNNRNDNWGRPKSRMLKLSMTDGIQQVFGLEYRFINGLLPDTPPGLKIQIKDVTIRRGLLLLTSENVQILGGSVESLIAARNEARSRKRKRRFGSESKEQKADSGPASKKRATDSGRNDDTFRTSNNTTTTTTTTTSSSAPRNAAESQPLIPEDNWDDFDWDLLEQTAMSQPPEGSMESSEKTADTYDDTRNAAKSRFFANSNTTTTTTTTTTTKSMQPSTQSRGPTPPPSRPLLLSPVPPTEPATVNTNPKAGIASTTENPTITLPLLVKEKPKLSLSLRKLQASATLQQPPQQPLLEVKEEPPAMHLGAIKKEPERSSSPISPAKQPPKFLPHDESESVADAFSLGSLFSEEAEEEEEEEEKPVDSPLPFTYLAKELETVTQEDRTITVKASLQCVIKDSFKFRAGAYALRVRIEDGTSSVVAAMSDDVVASLIGIPCPEFGANLTTAEGKKKNQQLMLGMEDKLFYLEALMDITLPGQQRTEELAQAGPVGSPQTEPLPTIIALRQPTATDIQHLAARARARAV